MSFCHCLGWRSGAASQLQNGAILVIPFHIKEVADAIYAACTMSISERKKRMKKLRQVIRKQDIFWWVDSFLRSAIAKRLSEFPQLEEYLPLTPARA
ncbi:MAG: trehalose-6-phosphate synthase [Thermogutta sp.]